MPRLPQRGLIEGVKMVAKAAATLVKQRAVLVKFLSPGSCGSNNLQETMGWDPTDAMFVTYVVASTNVPSTKILASPSVCCQGTSASRLSEEGFPTPGFSAPAVTIGPVGMATESDVMDQRPDVSCAVGVGNVGVAVEGLWSVKSVSAACAADIVVTANVGAETYGGDVVRVGLYASVRPSIGVGAVGAGIVFSIGTPSGSIEAWGSDAGDGVGTSFGVVQLARQRSVQLTLQRPVQRPDLQ